MENCITHPNERGLIIVRPWQMVYCDGDKCAAELLSLFEYWHNIKMRTVEQNKDENERRREDGLPPTENESTLQWHNREQLMSQLFNRYTHKTIQKSIDLLKNKKCLTQHTSRINPFNRTKFFQFHPDVINLWLQDKYFIDAKGKLPNRVGKITQSSGENYPMERVKLPNLLNTKSTFLEYNSKNNVGLCKKTTKQHENEIPYRKIIEYLNEKTNQSYRSTTPKTRELIKSRWNEGFNEKDFYHVIDNMAVRWRNNEKMKVYLRPHTLFSTKFESYLNQNDDKIDTALRNNEIGIGAHSILKMGDLE